MEQRLVCDTVKDLLPMYIDNMTSETSNKSIEEHINTCGECRSVLEQMRKPVEVETAPELKEFKKYLKKSRMNIFYWIMGVAAAIAIITCFIVNLAVEGRLSWFYIVVAGICTAYLPAYIGLNSTRHRSVKMLAALSICTIALLGIIQLVSYCYMEIGNIWFWDIGLPIALLWLVFVWIGVGCNLFLHTNVIISMGIFALLAVPGNFITNVIAGYYQGMQDFTDNFISNGLGNMVAAVGLLTIGIILQVKRRKAKE